MTRSLKYFGARGDGVTDDTQQIQDALNSELELNVTPGRYMVSGTLTGRPNQVLRGVTPELCQFVRRDAYGTTLKFGTDAAHAGAVSISGIWFNHEYTFNNGAAYVPGTSINILNKDPNAAHVQIYQGQNVRIKDCWAYGVGYGIDFIDSTVIWVRRCLTNGMWDAFEPGLQDSTSGISFRASTSDKRCAVIDVSQCHISGYGPGAPRTVTTGNASVTKSLNAGARYGVYMTSAERFVIGDNYIGGQSENSIFISAEAIVNHGHISRNMLDAARAYSIRINSANANHFANFIDIHDNTGVGYGIEEGFLHLEDSGSRTAAMRLHVHDNIGHFYSKAPIRLDRTYGAKVHDNTFGGYNCDGSTITDPYVQAGMVVGSECSDVESFDNTWGGGVTDPRSANHCKWGAYFSNNVNHSASNERSAGMGEPGGTLIGGLSQSYP